MEPGATWNDLTGCLKVERLEEEEEEEEGGGGGG